MLSCRKSCIIKSVTNGVQRKVAQTDMSCQFQSGHSIGKNGENFYQNSILSKTMHFQLSKPRTMQPFVTTSDIFTFVLVYDFIILPWRQSPIFKSSGAALYSECLASPSLPVGKDRAIEAVQKSFSAGRNKRNTHTSNEEKAYNIMQPHHTKTGLFFRFLQ